MATEPHRFVTPAAYLEFERKAEYKSELCDGVVYAMAGASREHNLLATNAARIIGNQLANRNCEVYQSDMRVRVQFPPAYFYPDVVVVCGKPALEDREFDTLLNPTVIIEVLSDTTENFDRGRKFDSYRSIESLEEYLMISQDEPKVLQYTRQSNGQWILTETKLIDGEIKLGSIDCSLPMAEIYRKIEFDPAQSSEELNSTVSDSLS